MWCCPLFVAPPPFPAGPAAGRPEDSAATDTEWRAGVGGEPADPGIPQGERRGEERRGGGRRGEGEQWMLLLLAILESLFWLPEVSSGAVVKY